MQAAISYLLALALTDVQVRPDSTCCALSLWHNCITSRSLLPHLERSGPVCAVQCVPVNSGFGKIAAFLARRRKAIYTMPGVSWEGYQPRTCGPAESDTVYRLADNWSGF